MTLLQRRPQYSFSVRSGIRQPTLRQYSSPTTEHQLKGVCQGGCHAGTAFLALPHQPPHMGTAGGSNVGPTQHGNARRVTARLLLSVAASRQTCKAPFSLVAHWLHAPVAHIHSIGAYCALSTDTRGTKAKDYFRFGTSTGDSPILSAAIAGPARPATDVGAGVAWLFCPHRHLTLTVSRQANLARRAWGVK